MGEMGGGKRRVVRAGGSKMFSSPFPSSDYVYNGYYINSVDSSTYSTARGFNYHQGPVSHTHIYLHFWKAKLVM
jgi:hypothetical protein